MDFQIFDAKMHLQKIMFTKNGKKMVESREQQDEIKIKEKQNKNKFR